MHAPSAAAQSGVARIAAVFAANRAAGRKAVAPFVTVGDPDVATTVTVLEAIDRAGGSLAELGVPYSDPIADGPVIQASYTRALGAGITLDGVFAGATGFLYCVSVAGVTGARTDLPAGLIDRVRWLRTKTDVPIMVGFGISGPEQARRVAEVADGVIVGSALVRLLGDGAGRPAASLPAEVERFVADLVAAVRA